MTPTQIEQLRFALSEPRSANWPASPIVPGNWRDLSGDLALNTVISICEWFEEEEDLQNLAADWSVDRVRVRPLSCYKDAVLVELGGHAGYGRPGLVNVIVHEDGMAILNGSSAVIHALNMDLPPMLETPIQRMDYLQLFMNWVHGDEGRFQPVGQDSDVLPRLLPDGAASIAEFTIRPFEESPPAGDSKAIANFKGTVLYGAALFRSVMALYPGGMVEMIDDEQLATNLPVRDENLVGSMMVYRI